MIHDWSEQVAKLVHAAAVTDADVARLRNLVWGEDEVSRPIVDGLFLINDHCAPESRAWTDFFIEAIEHFVLYQKAPHGFIDEPDAAWLKARVARKGSLASLTELELIVSIVESAENTPDDLKFFAMDEIERAVLSGNGPTRDGDVAAPAGTITADEAHLLRRLVFAGGGEGAVIVGGKEADMLLRLKTAALHGRNAPEWLQLFVQGVGNHLLAHSDYRPLARDEAERLNREMDANTPNVANFFRRMLPHAMFGRGTLVEAFKAVFPEGPLPSALRHGDAASPLTREEASWLKAHIAADGQVDDYEKALLSFIIDEVGNLPPQLDTLRKRA